MTNTVKRLRSDPTKYVPMYTKDKLAFLKESARIQPPVGGVVFVASKDETFELGGRFAGTTIESKKGESLGLMFVSNANRDR